MVCLRKVIRDQKVYCFVKVTNESAPFVLEHLNFDRLSVLEFETNLSPNSLTVNQADHQSSAAWEENVQV